MIKLLSEPKVTGAERMTFGMVVLDSGLVVINEASGESAKISGMVQKRGQAPRRNPFSGS